MANSSGISASIAGRYATALFDLAQQNNSVGKVEKSLSQVKSALGESDAMQALVSDPAISRGEAKQAVSAVAKKMKLDALTANTLGVLAENRRLDQAKAVIDAFETLAADARGELTAEVTSARALSAAQKKALTAKLKARMGRDVAINSVVDPSILGGLKVKVGSELIDSSIKTRLNSLATAMKG